MILQNQMASYGKRMLQASLKLKLKKHQPQIPAESDNCATKVANWFNTCCDSVSTVTTEMVPPSVCTEPLQADQQNIDYEDQHSEGSVEYQPNADTDSDSHEVSMQDCQVTSSTNEEPLVRMAVSKNGVIVLDKQQCCYYCEKPQLKLSRHLMTLHKKELAVARLLSEKSTNPKEYQKGLKRLKCIGNFIHNINSLKQNKNDIVVVKRPSKPRKISEYLPCIRCYGFYVTDELWKHTKNCDLNPNEESLSDANIIVESQKLLTISNVVQQSKFLLQSACLSSNTQSSMSEGMRTLTLAMHHDTLSDAVSKDKMLLLFGEMLLQKYGPMRKNDISQRMRQLARLLLKCRENLSDSNLCYYDLLCGKQFDTCLEGTFSACGLNITNDGRRQFETPSLALRLGHLLKKLVMTKQGFCLRIDDLDGLKEAESFGRLLEAEWTDAVATNAHNTLKRRKDHSVQVLPLTDDLRLLRQYQVKEIQHCLDSVQAKPLYSTWRKLAQLTMTRMTIFNKRRGGEVSKLLLETYKKRPDWKNLTNEEVLTSLQPLERTLLNRIDLVQIPGKKSRKVPMLITNDVKEGINALNTHRDAVGIPSSNPFCFASRSSSGHLDNWQALNLITQEASLKHPELVTSTKLRKYNATVSQLFDLNHGELEWLSNHMGHDLNIHKDFYRLHDSTIEIAKVSRLLMAIDSGNAAKFVGKQLNEITLDDFGYGDMENTVEERRMHSDSQETEPMMPEISTSEKRDNPSRSSIEPADICAEGEAQGSGEKRRHACEEYNIRNLLGLKSGNNGTKSGQKSTRPRGATRKMSS